MAFDYWTDFELVTKRIDVLWRRDPEIGFYERWDRLHNVWVRDAGGVSVTGIGGDTNYEDITLSQARKILADWDAPKGSATFSTALG